VPNKTLAFLSSLSYVSPTKEGGPKMVRLKLPEAEKRSHAVYVLLRPREIRLLERLAKKEGKSRAAILRDAFLWVYKGSTGL
jgi:hypothetical protein